MAQQPGGVGPITDFNQIPRFSMAQNYADMDRFSLVANSRPIPIADIEAGNLIRTAGYANGESAFTLLLEGHQAEQIACFSSDEQRLELSRSGAKVVVPLPMFVPGRNKVNCKAQSNFD
jgi:hypothetical protein|tara:strand:- start:80470 stop:80826 length:357 start_codon:yes stop_codon:yes gene_type:complete